MKLHRLFLKYCVRYLAAFLIILAVCGLLARVAYDSVEQYVIEVSQLRLQEGVSQIHQNIAQFDRLSLQMEGNEYFKSLVRQEGRLPPDEFLHLKYASEQMNTIGVLYPFAAYGFVLFRSNDMYISTSQCATDFERYFGSFLRVSAPDVADSADIRTLLFEQGDSPLRFLRVDSIEYYSAGKAVHVQDAVLYVIAGSAAVSANPSYVMAFVLRPEDLADRILLRSGDAAQTLVRIDAPGMQQPLLESAPGWVPLEDDEILTLQYRVPDIGWTVSVGIPRAEISEQCRDIRLVITLYICIGLLLVVALTLILSFRQYTKVRRLFHSLPDTERPLSKGQDEFDALGNMLADISENRRQYEKKVQALTQQNQAILLEQLIVHGINTPQERAEVEKQLPTPLEYFCVALVETAAADLQEQQLAVLCIMEYLKDQYPSGFAHVHVGTSREAFLLALRPDDAPGLDRIRQMFEAITGSLTEDVGTIFHVGISAVGADITNVSSCYEQARQVIQAYGRENQNCVGVYRLDINLARENMLGMELLDKLYNHLLYAQREPIRAQLQRLVIACQKMPIQFEALKPQIFYSIRNVIHCAYLHLGFIPQELPDYYKNLSAQEMADQFIALSGRFCDLVEGNRKSHNSELRDHILDYLSQQFAQPSLTACAVCREVGISEKYLSQFLKEQTGETFSSYLESVRIEAATRLLGNTDWSNERIAEATGFAALSTFYRAFNKRTGVSPGMWREHHTGTDASG